MRRLLIGATVLVLALVTALAAAAADLGSTNEWLKLTVDPNALERFSWERVSVQ